MYCYVSSRFVTAVVTRRDVEVADCYVLRSVTPRACIPWAFTVQVPAACVSVWSARVHAANSPRCLLLVDVVMWGVRCVLYVRASWPCGSALLLLLTARSFSSAASPASPSLHPTFVPPGTREMHSTQGTCICLACGSNFIRHCHYRCRNWSWRS